MKINKTISLPILVILAAMGCQSNAQTSTVSYTKIKDCIEQVVNDNAAFSKLKCSTVGDYSVNITVQSPQYFTVVLNHKINTMTSELESFTQELPMEPGKAIEWHLRNGKPWLMVFRLKKNILENSPQELLTLSLIKGDRICPIASIDTRKIANANEKMRELITKDFQKIDDCPKTILEF